MKKYLLAIPVIFIIYLIVSNSAASLFYARDAINICMEMIIPTLFPFFICSGILIHSGFCEDLARLFSFCMQPLFKINPTGSSAFVLGIISGYPLGAITAGELYENQYISKTEAERLIAFCNNSGPLFILGSVGAAIYADMKIGAILYITHILAALSVGIIFRFYKRNELCGVYNKKIRNYLSLSEIFNISLQNAIRNILTVCGAVVFFSICGRILLDVFPLSDTMYTILSGIMEFATGTVNISYLSIPLAEKLVLTAFIVGFAGISVHMQVIAVISRHKLSLVPYFTGKILHGILAAIYMLIYLHFNPITVQSFSPSMSKAFAAVSFYEALAVICVGIVSVLSILFLFVQLYFTSNAKNTNAIK